MSTRIFALIYLLLVFCCPAAKAQKLEIKHLTGNFYIYTTYKNLETGPYPSNSMYLVTGDGVVMFDTPWDSTQFQPLLDSVYTRHGKKVVLCISTHFHDDRTAGLEFLNQQSIATYTSKHTYDLCLKEGNPQPTGYFINDTTFTIGDYKFSTFYPGAGHTKDNILIWFEKDKILYGGCFIKSTENSGLGNIADADVNAWEASVKRTMKKFPQRKFIIPGHFGWSNSKSLEHTLKLVKAAKK